MRRLRFSLFIFLCSLLWACSDGSPEEQAARAARTYYQHLVDDRPAEFLDGKIGADSLPADYRAQMLAAINLYRATMVDKHKGLVDVQISDNVARRDTTLHLTYAFLLLCYGDSTQEEITVPMVYHSDRWLMK